MAKRPEISETSMTFLSKNVSSKPADKRTLKVFDYLGIVLLGHEKNLNSYTDYTQVCSLMQKAAIKTFMNVIIFSFCFREGADSTFGGCC